MNRGDLLTNEKFCANERRLQHHDEMNQMVADWIRSMTREDLLQLLDEYGVPVSPILNIKDIFEHPHYQARENIIEVKHPRLGKIKVPGIVPKFEKTPGTIRHIAPDLGEHNQEILQDMLGLSPEEIQTFEEKNVI